MRRVGGDPVEWISNMATWRPRIASGRYCTSHYSMKAFRCFSLMKSSNRSRSVRMSPDGQVRSCDGSPKDAWPRGSLQSRLRCTLISLDDVVDIQTNKYFFVCSFMTNQKPISICPVADFFL